MQFRLVAFDFDGTLADSGPWFLRALDELAVEFNFNRLAENDRARLRRCNAREVLQRLGIPLWKYPRVIARFRELASRDASQIPVFPGVPELFEKLNQQGRAVVILTSNSEETVRKVLGESISARVARFHCGASLFGKAAKLKQLFRETKTDRANGIYVGDEIRDFEASRKASVLFGGVAWGYTEAEALAALKPEFFFKSLNEIANLP